MPCTCLVALCASDQREQADSEFIQIDFTIAVRVENIKQVIGKVSGLRNAGGKCGERKDRLPNRAILWLGSRHLCHGGNRFIPSLLIKKCEGEPKSVLGETTVLV